MDDKTKISLLYMFVGGVLGVLSAFLSILGVPGSAILLLYVGVVYGTTYLYSLVGVKFEKLGERRERSALNGAWSSLLPWLVIWTMIFYIISPVIVLADASVMQPAEDLGKYLEANGVKVKITDNYARYLSAHKVVIFGSRVPIPLGTSYGVTVLPDAVQRLLALEKGKGTAKTEKTNYGELITVAKAVRLIIIIDSQKESIAQMVQEKKETILNLLS